MNVPFQNTELGKFLTQKKVENIPFKDFLYAKINQIKNIY